MITAELKTQKLSGLLRGALLVLVMLSAPGAALAEPTPDPLQPFNRAMFTFNDAVDRVVFRPLAVGYRAVLPQRVRNGVNNFSITCAHRRLCSMTFFKANPKERRRRSIVFW